MKKHLTRSIRKSDPSGVFLGFTVFHTWCNWETLDTRAIAESAHVPTADMCKRCMAAIAKLNRDSYLVPLDGE